VKGNLVQSDPPDSFALTRISHHKVHAVSLEAGKSYLIDLKGDFDTFLRIEDSRKKPLLYNDDVCPRDDLNSRILFTPREKDDYRVIVTSYQPAKTGAYTLQIREAVRADEPDVHKGRLVKTDKLLKGKFSVEHNVKLIGGCPYTIELESKGFDACLVLGDPARKKVLALNDGVAPGTTRFCRIDFTPKADNSFTIIVSSFRPGETGAYTLTIQRYQEMKKGAGK